ncbi:MAG: saccharopine dehydrogenase NADP-binding domain-containing protein [Bacteroidia bacterium]|nr:saccharopine dehydrogenase NADP-binding domain-containing protein [Bacteroidia bacterium]
MKKALIIGAGRSASSAITYLLEQASKGDFDWEIRVGDFNPELARAKVGGHPKGEAIFFDVFDEALRRREVEAAQMVISFLPPHLHVLVAKDCIEFKTHLVTASYVSDEMQALDAEARKAGILLLNELGADPGIDHMSAMETIDRIKAEGGKLEAFRSYCGALIAPECNNIWGYKFTWAPRNIILAGQGGPARYMKDGHIRYIPSLRLFAQVDTIEIPGYGSFEAYANRNSLGYRKPYGLMDTATMYRATLRMPGFCQAWDALVRIGLTDNSYKVDYSATMPWREFLMSYIPEFGGGLSNEARLAKYLNVEEDGEIIEKIKWTGMLSEQPIFLENASPADILQDLLEKKWVFEAGDTDMLVMQHQYEWTLGRERKRMHSSLVVMGEDSVQTAISRTVGLPAAMGAKLLMENKLTRTGVAIPTTPDIYAPILRDLENHGIIFTHEEF